MPNTDQSSPKWPTQLFQIIYEKNVHFLLHDCVRDPTTRISRWIHRDRRLSMLFRAGFQARLYHIDAQYNTKRYAARSHAVCCLIARTSTLYSIT